MVNRGVVFLFLATVGLAPVACVAPVDMETEQAGVDPERSPIVGGAEEWGFPLVGTLAGSGGAWPFCTATPVTPTVLITAAHCLDAFASAGGSVQFLRLTPDGLGPRHGVITSTRRWHPGWDTNPWGGGYVNDVGLVMVSDRIDVDMFPAMSRSQATRGTPLKVVGFGVSSPPDGGSGTKRSIDMSVTGVHGQYFEMVLSDYWRGVCYGDSGGPSFVLGEHRNTQLGVHARTQVESCGPAEDTDVGYFYNDFVRGTFLSLDSTAANCGDGICTGIEQESDCPDDCAPFECGDGVAEGPEACDDGNTVDGDGCSANCLSNETCGNGIVDGAVGEVCDDSNATGGDGCSGDCRSDETCGNGITDLAAGEMCDDDNIIGGDGCSSDCRSDETCGNGIHDNREACDDSNHFDGDGCSADCMSDESCGNNIVDTLVGEVCDDGNAMSGDGCSADCRVAEGCGDGFTNTDWGEVCDDGNTRGGDGCSANCRSDETCGNGVLDVAMEEQCDDGNTVPGDDCPEDCGVPEYGGIPGISGGCGCGVAAPASRNAAQAWRNAIGFLFGW